MCIIKLYKKSERPREEARMIKSIEELTIVDDFMFGAVMRESRLCKPLLELVLNVKIRKIEYPELQKNVE